MTEARAELKTDQRGQVNDYCRHAPVPDGSDRRHEAPDWRAPTQVNATKYAVVLKCRQVLISEMDRENDICFVWHRCQSDAVFYPMSLV